MEYTLYDVSCVDKSLGTVLVLFYPKGQGETAEKKWKDTIVDTAARNNDVLDKVLAAMRLTEPGYYHLLIGPNVFESSMPCGMGGAFLYYFSKPFAKGSVLGIANHALAPIEEMKGANIQILPLAGHFQGTDSLMWFDGTFATPWAEASEITLAAFSDGENEVWAAESPICPYDCGDMKRVVINSDIHYFLETTCKVILVTL